MIFQQDIPSGYKKGSPGWALVVPTSKDKKMSKIKQENADLKQRLEQLEAAVSELAMNTTTTTTKKKK